MCKHGTQIVAPLPDDIDPDKENRSASLDECIAETILALWDEKIQTRGCCCGHGERCPDVVIGDTEDAQRTAEIIRSVDSRHWRVLQWQLVEAALVNAPERDAETTTTE